MTIAVDFDGTIVTHEYPKIGKPIPFAIETLLKLQQEEHHTLILWSVREGELLDEAIAYCESKGLRFYAANKNHPEEDRAEAPRKLTADMFIDDRNVGGMLDWGLIYRIIKTGNNNPFDDRAIEDYEYPRHRANRKKNFFIRLGEALDRARGQNF